MKRLILKVLGSVLTVLFLLVAPKTGNSQNCNCTSTGNFPATVNGINITQSASGSVNNYGANYTNCGLSTGPMWLGSGGAFVQTFNFSQPVNNIGYMITATNDTEFFTFSVNGGGVLNATQGCGCGFTQNGNTFGGTLGMNGSGTIIFLNSSQPYTSITINGTGTGNGSLVGLCVQSFSACTTPTLTVIPSSTVCQGTPKTLTVTGAPNYSWTPAFGLSATTGSNVIATPSITTTYTILGGTGSCTNTAITTLTVLPAPIPTLTSNSPVCSTKTLNLTSSASNTYSWTGPNGFTSTSQNPSINNVSTLASGIYSLSVTAPGVCPATNTINVTVNASPTVVTSNTVICAGLNLNLSSNFVAGATYLWNGPNAYTSNVQNPVIANAQASLTGAYNITITSAAGCTGTAVSNVTVNALPVVTASNNSPLCSGNAVIFSGSGGGTYSWTGPNAYASALQNPIINNAATSVSGNYSLTVTAANSCTARATTSVIVNPTPTVTTTGTVICAGQVLNINSNLVANASYFWAGPNSFTASTQNISIPNAQSNLTGAYNLIVTTTANCTGTAVANVTVNAIPIANASSNAPLCAGNNLNLTGNGGATYAWAGPNAFTSNLQNPSITAATTNASGVYSLVASAGNCTSMATTTVVVNANPVIAIGNTGPVCETKTVSLNASGGNSYNWSGPLGFTSNQQNPLITSSSANQAGVYTVTVTNTNNCTSTATTSLVVNANPNVIASGGTVCIGVTSSLSAGGGANYAWFGPNGFTSTSQNIQIPNTTQSNVGTYTVVVTAPNTCTSYNTANIGVHPSPVINMSNSGPVCIGKEVKLQSSGGLIYSWTGPNNFVSNEANTGFIADNISTSGNYVVTVIDNKGCSNSQTMVVTVHPLPTANLASSSTKNCVPFCSTFSVVGTNSQLQSVNWLTTFGGNVTGNVLNKCFTEAGDFTFRAAFTDVNGCSNTSSFVATAYPLPVANFGWEPGTPVEKIDPVIFNDQTTIGGPATEWNWWFIKNTNYSNQKSPSFVFENPGVYPVALVVRNKWGCADSIVKLVTVNEDYGLYIPNAFSPDGDEINDVFQPKGFGIKNYTMTIFDRWGEVLFTSKDFYTGWDGTSKGAICKNDVYVFKITLTNSFGKNIEKIGHVTLMK